MAEDPHSRELLQQLIERLDLMERLLAGNTTRLHAIEGQLGIVRPPQSIKESLARESGVETHSAPSQTKPQTTSQTTSQTKPEDLRPSQPTRPPTPPSSQPPVRPPTQSTPVAPPSPELPLHTWSMPEPTETRATHPWMNEAAKEAGAANEAGATKHSGATKEPMMKDAVPPRPYATREAATPFALHAPVEAPVVLAEGGGPAGVDSMPKRRDLESMVGGRWFNWIGIIAVTFGIAFFLKFAFDQQWIGPTARISLSALVGVTLLYVAERLRTRGLTAYAYVLSGGGILILYLADFAAYNFYHLISQPLAFLLMALVTTVAVLLSVRLDALPVAILGLVGGFMTPLLLSTGVDNEIGLFTYIALLDAGVLAVAYFKSWRSLDFLSFAGTVAITLGWASGFYEPSKVWVTLFFLSIFFGLYSLLAIFHNVLPKRPTRWFDVALTIANATFYFGLSYVMLQESGFDTATPATQALLAAVFFTGLFYTTWRWNSDDRLLRYSYVGAAATFLSMAVAIQLELHWVTIGWAIQALMLAWVGLRSGERAARHAALVVFCVAVGHWFFWDMPVFAFGVDPSFLPLLNRRALSSGVLVGAIAGAAWLYRRSADGEVEGVDEAERETARTFFLLTGNAVALTLLSLDLNDYFTARLSQGAAAASVPGPLENARQFSLSTLWTLYATTTLAFGVLRRSALLRWGGLLLLVAAIAKVVVLDTAFYAAWWHLPVLNLTVITYALLVAALAFAAWLYGRPPGIREPEERWVRPAMIVVANVLALAAISLEVLGYYDRLLALAEIGGASSTVFSGLHENTLFAMVLVWIIYATGAFIVGAWRDGWAWRWGGVLLYVLTIPLVLAQLSYYDASWHMLVLNRTLASFALFVAALWFVARTYERAGENFEEGSTMRPVAIVVANLLALTALSLEVVAYYNRLLAGAALQAASAAVLGQLQEGRLFAVAVVWIIYATGTFLFGAWRDGLAWRWGGLMLLVVTTPLVLAQLSYYEASWHVLVLNQTLAAFALFVAALWIIARVYERSGEKFEEASTMRPIAIVAGNLLAIVALSAQAAGYYDAKMAAELSRAGSARAASGSGESLRNLELAKQLSLSVVWGLYASGMLIAGQFRRLRMLRVMALALLSLTTLKVFIWDLSSLDRVYRIISFIMLGAILLLVSYFYQRSQQRADEAEEEESRNQMSDVRGQRAEIGPGTVVSDQ